MGRAIDFENKLDGFESRVVKLEETLSEILQTMTVKTNIDLTETTKEKNAKQKTNNEGSKKGSRKSSVGSSTTKSKSS